MDDDKRLARLIGLSLSAICLICFTLSALALP
jgi:hypothetical protein